MSLADKSAGVFTIPYSFAADKYGHAPILSLSIFGLILEMVWPLWVAGSNYLPFQWVWFAVVFEILGGGVTVSLAMINLILLDQVSHASRYCGRDPM